MPYLIVITGLDQIVPAERWSRFVEPLAAQLTASGLGELPDLAALRAEFQRLGEINTAEIAVRLVNFDYGKELVEGFVEAVGLSRRDTLRPERWKPFHCDDYFNSEYARSGYWDEPGQYWYLKPFNRVFEDEQAAFLVVGGAGVDGICFGYWRGHTGFWAYPVDGEFVRLADTVTSFMEGWLSGKISV